MHTDINVLCCPVCDTEIERSVRHNGFTSGGTSIGPSTVPCPECGMAVRTGKSEWADKGMPGKTWFFVTRLLWLLASSFFFAGGFGLLIAQFAVGFKWIAAHEQMDYAVRIWAVLTVILVALFILRAKKEISASLGRMAYGRSDLGR